MAKNLASVLEELDDETLSEFFSEATLQRARGYLSKISQMDWQENRITARIQGSTAAPYLTAVRLVQRPGPFGQLMLDIQTSCTCPVGKGCKHVAALLIAARRAGAPQDRPREQVLRWAQTLAERRGVADPKASKPSSHALMYVIAMDAYRQRPALRIFKARVDRQGRLNSPGEPWYNVDQALLKAPAFVQQNDMPVLRLVREVHRRSPHSNIHGECLLSGVDGVALLQAALATGRLYASGDGDLRQLIKLQEGAARPIALSWGNTADGTVPILETTPPCTMLIPTLPLWYADVTQAQLGPVQAEDQAVLLALLELPPLRPCELPLVGAALQDQAPSLPAPRDPEQNLVEIDAPLQPVLKLETLHPWVIHAHRDYPGGIDEQYDVAQPMFRYGEATVMPGQDSRLITLPDGRPARIQRQPDAEAAAMKALAEVGFQPLKQHWLSHFTTLPEGLYGLASEIDWKDFFFDLAPTLREAGWQIEYPDDFRHHIVEVSNWFAELDDQGNGWLDVSLGIEVEGERMDLAPLLHALFKQDARWLDPVELAAIGDDESVVLESDDGLRLRLPAARIKPLAATLIDLFDRAPDGPLRLSVFDAPRLQEALAKDWQRQGFERLEGWLNKLRGISCVQPVPAPEGFQLTLRPYQMEGLAWLQHLRAHELAGILADDMGLGKTAQVLAHLLVEKRAGRMDRPSLVVLPTSLVFNWAREAERFAPDLKVLKLHGKDRAAQFDAIAQHDVCLSTYPLLWRDQEVLSAQPWHLLILDEAQTVKNAASQGAKVVRQLNARHRLCITGTPLENHLGELWSQFDFLLPGFLGDSRDFARQWRTPIEKHGDALRRELLAKRIAPFILRRRKEDVAAELPPKTIVVRDVEITGRQRDLYETVRAAMDKQVRDAIAAKGFARSQIMILDALLKLRQVCCDPRLLKTSQAQKVKERAKLDLLMEMLPELVEEGRKVLVFSQFTEMLDLIEDELAAAKIPHVKLTGQTKKREEAVNAFQQGEVPVFLISLKAGGVGLNLTAADTVIHYDPWWNPAAENQATDRAHRIGQQRNVFVYKLVVAGSIEEKILALQEKKAQLAAGVLAEDHEGDVKFGEEDLASLFAPLPER